MKKMIIVLLSLAMVLAFAGTAYAATTGNNDTTRGILPDRPTHTRGLPLLVFVRGLRSPRA
jgi:hypothetical protein